MRCRVHHFAPLQPATGGIASVVTSLLEDAPDPKVCGMDFDSTNTYSTSPWRAVLRALILSTGLAVRPLTFEVAHLHVSRGASLIRKWMIAVAIRRRASIVLQLHNGELERNGGEWWERALLGGLMRRSDVVLCLSDTSVSFAQSVALVARSEFPIQIVRNPAPDLGMRSRQHGDRSVLFVGRLGHRKATDVLLRAMAALPRDSWSQLALAGDGSAGEYRRLASDLEIDQRCIFLGWQSREQIRVLMQRSAVLVLPSRAEGLPMTIVEAMSIGLPVVATRVGGISGLLTHERNALLADPDDVIGLSQQIWRALSMPSEMQSLANHARELYESTLTPAAVWRDLLKTYSRICRS